MSTDSTSPDGAIGARALRGFRDYFPPEMMARARMIATIRQVCERYGFAPMDTPALEHLDVLLGKYGDEGSQELFRLETAEGEAAALRFDLTVPLARFVAEHADLPRPLRRYQVAPVWRMDKPAPGRFREFVQFDIDIVGSASTVADVEVVAAVSEIFATLGLPRCQVRLSSRRLLDALLAFAGIDAARAHAVFRVLDKLDKQGREAVLAELTTGRTDASGAEVRGLGLGRAEVARIERFLALPRHGRGEVLDAVEALLAGSAGAEAALAELRAMDAELAALGLAADRVVFDPSLARGLDYYTGPVFEGVLLDAPEFGSIFGGGRYDRLVERFLGRAIPATGGSVGVDRLLAALTRLGRVEQRPSPTQVLVTVLDPGLMREYLRIAAELRAAGINAEVYLGDQRGLKKQLAYADRLQVDAAVLLGGDELALGEVSVKDLAEGKRQASGVTAGREEYLTARFGQRAVKRAELVATLRRLLGQ